MSRWIRADQDADADLKIGVVIKKQKNPEVHRLMSSINVRGGVAYVVKTLLEQAAASGTLQKLIAEIDAPSAAHPQSGGMRPLPRAPSEFSLEEMRKLNRF